MVRVMVENPLTNFEEVVQVSVGTRSPGSILRSAGKARGRSFSWWFPSRYADRRNGGYSVPTHEPTEQPIPHTCSCDCYRPRTPVLNTQPRTPLALPL